MKRTLVPGDRMKPETMVLHAGWRADTATGSVAVPIHQTTSYLFEDTGHAARLFSLEEQGNIYTRFDNPTIDILERRLAELEGGTAAVAVSSGQAACAYALQNVARAGDNIVSSTDLYGGTWNLFANTLRDQGIEVRFVDQADPSAFVRATDKNTRAYFGETLSNPKLTVFPIAEVAELGRQHGIPLIIDNTTTPIIARPLEHGAAVVVYSATKYIAGHGTSLGGVIIDGGSFDWPGFPERQPLMSRPDKSYGNKSWIEIARNYGPMTFALRARLVLLRDLGSSLSPFNAFQILQGLETLPLRMPRHCENARAVADFLRARNEVVKVVYPSLPSNPMLGLARRYLPGGGGGLVGFELRGGIEAGRRFIEALKLFYHVANIGDARSLAIHPASTTHAQVAPEARLAAGVTEGYVRLSIGIEHIDDILGDLSQAIEASQAW
jgi:O-acetylhomoserine (thiol)-lyase